MDQNCPRALLGQRRPRPKVTEIFIFIFFILFSTLFIFFYIFLYFFIFYNEFLLVQIWVLGGGGALWGQNRPLRPPGNQQASIFQFRWWPAGLSVSALLLEPKAKQTQGDQQASIFKFGWWPAAPRVLGLPLNKFKTKWAQEQQGQHF